VIDRPPFEVTETGWGEFEIQIRVAFVTESAEKPISMTHMLKLHAWPIVKSIQGAFGVVLCILNHTILLFS
jgi:YEATS domain-containing protein 4